MTEHQPSPLPPRPSHRLLWFGAISLTLILGYATLTGRDVNLEGFGLKLNVSQPKPETRANQ